MPRESMTVLVISSSDEAREGAYVVVSGLKDNGHDGLICCSPEAETKIKPDLRLDDETSLGGVSGVIVLDDGGDAVSCATVVAQANKNDLVVGGIGVGGRRLHHADRQHRLRHGLGRGTTDRWDLGHEHFGFKGRRSLSLLIRFLGILALEQRRQNHNTESNQYQCAGQTFLQVEFWLGR